MKKREHPKPGTLIRILTRPGSKSRIREEWIALHGHLYIARASPDDTLQCTSLVTGKQMRFINDYWEEADDEEG